MGQAQWICTLGELTAATSGRAVSSPRGEFSRVGTDSRGDLAGRLFIPLRGEKFDAHDFVPQAVANGAAVVLVDKFRDEWRDLSARASFVEVGDTLRALQDLALAWRQKHKFTVIGITGSNGKTSTKEFLFAILKDYLSTHASKGSFNNHWGVPLSLLDADSSHTHVICEMGMNHAGEITRLCEIARPDIVCVTTVGRAHIGELGSAEAVARAKEEIYQASPNAIQVFNGDNEWTMAMPARSKAAKKIVFSSFKTSVDVSLRALRLTWDGLEISGHIKNVAGQTWVRVLGRHNVVNIMAAGSLSLAAGLSPDEIWAGFERVRDSGWGRNQLLTLKNGAKVLWDGYNANPDSMTALMKNLFEMDVPGRKYLIVGDMRELGDYASQAHQEIGERAAQVGFAEVWYVGAHAKDFRRGLEKGATKIPFVESAQADPAVSRDFLERLGPEDLVAVKASRGVALEKAFATWPLKTPLGPKT